MVALILIIAGCAGPGPELCPVCPVREITGFSGQPERHYDMNGDRRADYGERLDTAGRIDAILRWPDLPSKHMHAIVLGEIPAHERRHALIILDSIPFHMVRDAWANGRFRFFHPPRRIISPFPVMTDPCLAEFFGVSPCPGVESEHFDGERLTDGYDVYLNKGNVPWHRDMDYTMQPFAHGPAYLWPHGWYRHELRRIQNRIRETDASPFITYIVSTSALGAQFGRNGHQTALIELDRFCQRLMFESRGTARITLMSDHGHDLHRGVRVSIADELGQMGYRVGRTLDEPGDVVVPEFGLVSYVGIHTREAPRVARDVIGLEGVELAAYRDQDAVVVLSRTGRACIEHHDGRLRYTAETGDPLQLAEVPAHLDGAGQIDADGFISSDDWFAATVDHVYPDAVARLWRAFGGLVVNTPDVLVSMAPGYHCGSAGMTDYIDLIGVHGSLRPPSSTGFVMTMAGVLPEATRMADLADELRKIGVPVP